MAFLTMAILPMAFLPMALLPTSVHTSGRDKTFPLFRKCAHPSMAKAVRKWLAAGSPSHEALKSIVSNERLLADIKQTNAFTHTGRLESYHH